MPRCWVMPGCRDALSLADWVSVKVDANDEAVWKKINRPHPKLTFESYKEGLLTFASAYRGLLATETMMVEGVNDGAELLQRNASLIATINPATAYISISTRPPAMRSVKKPDEAAINRAYQIYTAAACTARCCSASKAVIPVSPAMRGRISSI